MRKYPTERVRGYPVSKALASFTVSLQIFLEGEGKDDPATWAQVTTDEALQLLNTRVRKLNSLDLHEVSPKELYKRSLLVACCTMLIAEHASIANQAASGAKSSRASGLRPSYRPLLSTRPASTKAKSEAS